MLLKSSAFENDQAIPLKYAKAGQNVSPPLSWENVPAGTQSFALAVVDLHPVAKNYVHWLVVGIGADVTALAEEASGKGMPTGSKELKAYTGPNPPSGSHDYELTLYALKTDMLDLPKKVSLDLFREVVQQNTLTTAKLVGKFAKNRTK